MNSKFGPKEFREYIDDLRAKTITPRLKDAIIDAFDEALESQNNNPEYILAIDFDLTICMSDYPELGPMREDAAEVIRALYSEGFGIVINTCREGIPLSDAIHWLRDNGIPYHYINCNFPHLIEKFGADCRKISANMYIDDKGIDPLPTWKEIYDKIHEKFKQKSS